MSLERERSVSGERTRAVRLRYEVVGDEYPDDRYPVELWEKVEGFAMRYLQEGRPGWDVPHTQAVVHWTNRLVNDYNRKIKFGVLDGAKVDREAVITAALLHDIGYWGEFDEVADLQQVTAKKKDHMTNGAEMAKHFLESQCQELLDEEQMEQVVSLVGSHDDLEKINALGMAGTVLMEADTLGAMDTEWVQPSYKGREALTFPVREKSLARRKRFKTPLGRQSLDDIVHSFLRFVINRDFEVADSRV